MNKYTKHLNFLAVLLFLLTFQNLNGQDTFFELKKDFRKKIEKRMKKNKIAGASVMLIEGDSVIWEEYFGFADKARNQPVDENTLFKTGSVTKPITGAAIMKQVENGQIDLDEPLKKYLPEFNIKQRFENAPPISTRMVMTHRAGIPCDIMRGISAKQPESYEDELELLNQEFTIFAPNKVRAYSNPGFNLLGILIDKTEYPAHIESEVFKPLKMNQSRFWGYEKPGDQVSLSYSRKGELVDEARMRQTPAGGMLSNARDLSKFLIEFLPENNRNDLLSAATKKEMLRNQGSNSPLDMGEEYGLVWDIHPETAAGKIYSHGGSTFYNHSMVAFAPESNFAVVLQTNSDGGSRIAYSLYDDILIAAAERKGFSAKAKTKTPKYSKTKIKLSDGDLKSFEGKYANSGMLMRVEKNKKKLNLFAQDQKLQLIPVGKGAFMPKIKLLGILGLKLKSMRINLEEIDGQKMMTQESTKSGRKEIIAVEATSEIISEKWRNRFGSYEVINHGEGDFQMAEKFGLKENLGFLEFSFTINLGEDEQQESTSPLFIVSDNLAYVGGIGRQSGYAVQVKTDEQGEEYLYFSGYELRKK